MAVAQKLKVTLLAAGSKPGNLEQEIDVPDTLRFLEDGETVPPGHCIMRIVNQKDGDKRVVWDSRDMRQIADAKETFDKLVAEGLVPYRVDPQGRKTPEVMSEFDATAEEIIFSPIHALAGG